MDKVGAEDAQVVQANHVSSHFSTMEHFMTVRKEIAKKEKSRCLKITEKVSFNIASEASYVYILSGQKYIKKAKNGQFWRGF